MPFISNPFRFLEQRNEKRFTDPSNTCGGAPRFAAGVATSMSQRCPHRSNAGSRAFGLGMLIVGSLLRLRSGMSSEIAEWACSCLLVRGGIEKRSDTFGGSVGVSGSSSSRLLACPFCIAKPGQRCSTTSRGFRLVHVARIKAAATKEGANKRLTEKKRVQLPASRHLDYPSSMSEEKLRDQKKLTARITHAFHSAR